MKHLKISSQLLGCVLLCGTLYAQSDSKFVKDASEGGMAEVKLGELAQQKGQSQAVKDFGHRMVADHSKAGDELKGIAAQEGMTTASSPSIGYDALRAKLAVLSGASFDKAYMSAMLKDHEDDIAAFQKEADAGADPKIKHFAAKTLPTLHEHLKLAQKAAAEVGANQ
jgi:putative membrane protein